VRGSRPQERVHFGKVETQTLSKACALLVASPGKATLPGVAASSDRHGGRDPAHTGGKWTQE
jgi:hypothetical protein